MTPNRQIHRLGIKIGPKMTPNPGGPRQRAVASLELNLLVIQLASKYTEDTEIIIIFA